MTDRTDSPADAQAGPLTERAAFDAWAGDQGFPLARLDIGDGEDYCDLRTQGAWDAWQARAAIAAAAQPQQPAPLAQEPAAALVRARNVSTRAEIAFDGKDHFSEWGEWYPTTYKHAKAVTDPSRNSDPVLYEMRPLYTMATSQSKDQA